MTHTGMLLEVREALAQCIDNTNPDNYRIGFYQDALPKLDALIAAVPVRLGDAVGAWPSGTPVTYTKIGLAAALLHEATKGE